MPRSPPTISTPTQMILFIKSYHPTFLEQAAGAHCIKRSKKKIFKENRDKLPEALHRPLDIRWRRAEHPDAQEPEFQEWGHRWRVSPAPFLIVCFVFFLFIIYFGHIPFPAPTLPRLPRVGTKYEDQRAKALIQGSPRPHHHLEHESRPWDSP